jgi:signal transduction histidine kinase/CheY-like chemotaxis protein
MLSYGNGRAVSRGGRLALVGFGIGTALLLAAGALLHAAATSGGELQFLSAAALVLGAVALLSVAFVSQVRSRQRAERRMRELAESLPGAVFQCRVWPDGRMRYEFLSSSARRVRGVEREAALRDPQTMVDTIHEGDRKMFRDAIAFATARGKPVDVDFRIHHPEKGVRWIRSVAAPSPQPDGSRVWSGHWADITTQKEMEGGLLRAMEEADAANEAKSHFLATMSHEIRTPMNGVLAMLELLSLTRLDEEQAASLAIVRESGHALLRIIDDILDFSKIEAGKMDIVPEAASLARLVERVVNIYSGMASRKGLALNADVDAGIAPALLFDPVRLQQVIGNLVNNAIKFTPSGEVSIRVRLVEVRPTQNVLRLEVRDTGIGMTAVEQERVFEAFTQASADTTSRFGGTGLGLSISRQLTRLMGGTIEIRSHPGEGTEVRVTLPLPVADAKALAAPAASVLSPPARAEPPPVETAVRDGRLVLVVDDHPINRIVLLKQVNALGYAGEIAEDGADALRKWESRRFGLLLLDCNMPRMSGYDVARAIRAREREAGLAPTRIVACTANALVGEDEKCFEAGMDDYVTKPVELAQLSGKLTRWLQNGPVEAQALDEVSGGDERLAHEMLERFWRYNEDDAQALRDAFRRRSGEGVMEACHRIKGAGRTIGAQQLAAACERAELAARSGDWPGVESALAAFEREVTRLAAFIESRKAAA